MENAKVLNVEMKDNKIIASVDSNKDGEPSLVLKINSPELIQEIFDKGEAKLDVKTITFKMELTKLKMFVDTDKDGEAVVEGELDLPEVFDEATSAIKK